MVEDWISQANARQRRGRAGRVKPGNCFCLYTRHRFGNLMRPFQVLISSVQFRVLSRLLPCYNKNWLGVVLDAYDVKIPEMLRMPLVELCLQIKLLSLGNIKAFLLKVCCTVPRKALSIYPFEPNDACLYSYLFNSFVFLTWIRHDVSWSLFLWLIVVFRL